MTSQAASFVSHCFESVVSFYQGGGKVVFTFVHSESDSFRIAQVKTEDYGNDLLNPVIY